MTQSPGEALDQRIGAMERRLSDLEAAKNQISFVEHGVLHHTSKEGGETADGRPVVDAKEWDRLTVLDLRIKAMLESHKTLLEEITPYHYHRVRQAIKGVGVP